MSFRKVFSRARGRLSIFQKSSTTKQPKWEETSSSYKDQQRFGDLYIQEEGQFLHTKYLYCLHFDHAFNSYFNQLTTSQNFPCLEKPIQLFYCHVARNLANCVFNQLTYNFRIVYMFLAYNGEMVKWQVHPINITAPLGLT